MTTSSDDRRDAEEALWLALEQRAAEHRKAGVKFSESQHRKLHKHHRQGRLIDSLNRAMEKRAGRVNKLNSTNLRAMAETLDNGLELWEQILIRPNAPWRPYVTYRARQGAQKSIEGAEAWASVKKVMRPGKRDPARPLQGGAFELGKKR
jgi:hypothetical protein